MYEHWFGSLKFSTAKKKGMTRQDVANFPRFGQALILQKKSLAAVVCVCLFVYPNAFVSLVSFGSSSFTSRS